MATAFQPQDATDIGDARLCVSGVLGTDEDARGT